MNHQFNVLRLGLCHKQLPGSAIIRTSTVATRGLRTIHAAQYSLPKTAEKTFLPQTVDLLQTYQGLVALGKIKPDEEQIRVVMQLRRLHKELKDYAPPALTSHYLDNIRAIRAEASSEPWWLHNEKDAEVAASMRSLIRVKTHGEDLAELTTPKGLLLTGPPGAGKTFLVDLWFNSLPTPYKARKHYNQLTLEIYRAVWEETQRRMTAVHQGQLAQPAPEPAPSWNTALQDRWRELASTSSLPMKWMRKPSMAFTSRTSSTQHTIAFIVAQRLILRHWLIVFDEIQLLDVSSATLLADVLSWFWRMGGVIVGTSNKVPDDLYKNGVQRDRLEPFVEAMKVRCPVVSMRSQYDWRERRAGLGTGRSWYTRDQVVQFASRVKQLSAETSTEPKGESLRVFGRTLSIPWALGDTCKFSFEELCEQSLGHADYITIASTFRTVIVTEIPLLTLSAKNQARRFISLIDALYEARCQLICLADAAPEDLFFPDASTSQAHPSHSEVDTMMAETISATRSLYRPNVASYDAPSMADPLPAPVNAPALETLSIFSGKEEQFAFKRALSRLLEMTSESYQREEQWTPLPFSVRKWEHGQSIVPQEHGVEQFDAAPSYATPTQPSDGNASDFAEEAAYEAGATAGTSQRPEAPKIREEHMWGIREDTDSLEHRVSQRRSRKSVPE